MSTALFVRGCPRSGTTLLADILNEVPEIGLLVEYPFGMLVRHLLPILWFERNVETEIARAHENERRLKAGEAVAPAPGAFFVPLENKEQVHFKARYPTRELFPSIVESVVETSLQKTGLQIVGSKTPGRWDDVELRLVKQYFGQPKYVFVLRNPLETVNSIINRRNFARAGHDHWPYETVARAVEVYREAICQLMSCARSEPRATFVLGYEDLLADPARTLGALSEFLGVEVSDRSALIRGSAHAKLVLTPEEEREVRAELGPAIEAWPRKTITGGVEDLAARFDDCLTELVPSRELRFDAADVDRGVLGPAWSAFDGSGVWTESATGELFFRVPADGTYAITMEFAAYVPAGAPPIHLTVAMNGVPAIDGNLTDLRILRVRMGPLALRAGTANVIRFGVDPPRSAASLGLGPDERTLGVCLRGVLLESAEAAS
ncbi:MAG: sulfotransferase [Candidatus Eremiobacteraeota bacterium]|nr:sulfotransferase [Candidatus Eremiobacteraeota bacterium]